MQKPTADEVYTMMKDAICFYATKWWSWYLKWRTNLCY